jgi:predicted CopG family antitoxin
MFTLVNISDSMPTERINDEVYDKVKRIMKRMGWKSFSYALEQILKDIDPEKFTMLLQIVRVEGEVR